MASESGTVSAEDWICTVESSLTRQESSPFGDALPAFPSEEMQRSTTSIDGRAAIRQAGAFYGDVVQTIHDHGADLGPGDKMLDFGCGWGRISRMFLRNLPMECIHGIDVDPEYVETCCKLFGNSNFKTCTPLPPTQELADSFDLVVSYSVFSHLSEEATRAWINEFHRLLKPGGFLAFTTRHATFFDYVDWARTADSAEGYTKELGALFESTDAARAQLAVGNLVHATSNGVSGGGVRDESFYGETWIPESYLDCVFADKFERLATCFDPDRYDQVAYILRKCS